MKHVSFLSLLLLLSSGAYAQDAPAEVPADPPVAPTEPVVPTDPAELSPENADGERAGEGRSDEGVEEFEGAEGQPGAIPPETTPVVEPEPEVSEPEPEVSEPATGLGEADPDATVTSDVAAAEAEAGTPDVVATADGEEGEEGAASTADRLGDVNGGVGLPWTAPITWTHNLSARTLNPSGQLTYDPTYSWSFSVRPRWIFDNGLSIGVRQDLDVELTDSNFTAENRQLWWGDTQLDATYTLPWKPGGIIISPAFTVRLPTSEISRGQSRVLGPGVRLLALRALPVANGLILGGIASYTGWLRYGGRRIRGDAYEQTNSSAPNVVRSSGAVCSVANSGQGGAADGASSTGNVSCAGGPGTLDNSISAGVFATLIPIDRMSVNMSFVAVWNRNSGLGTDCVETLSGTVCRDDNSQVKWNTLTSFAFSVGYDFKPYFTASVGYSTLSFFPDSDGSFENFLFNENTQLSLSLQFRPGALIADHRARDAARAAEEDEGDEGDEGDQAANALGNFNASRL